MGRLKAVENRVMLNPEEYVGLPGEENLVRLFEVASTKYNMGDYKTFIGNLQNPELRQKFYKNVNSDEIPLGSFKEFQDRVTVPGLQTGIGGALKGGLQESVTGFAVRGKMPEPTLTTNMFEELAQSAAQLFGDIPFMVAGAAIGGASGAAATPLGAAITGTGAAFALPATIRHIYVEKYTKGEINTFSEFWDRFGSTLGVAAKEYITGAATGAVTGGMATKAVARTNAKYAKLVGGDIRYIIDAKTGHKFIDLSSQPLSTNLQYAADLQKAVGRAGVVSIPAEVATFTTLGAALEGRVPEPEDFLHGALLVFGMKGVHYGKAKFDSYFIKDGMSPDKVIEEIRRVEKVRLDFPLDKMLPADLIGNIVDGLKAPELIAKGKDARTSMYKFINRGWKIFGREFGTYEDFVSGLSGKVMEIKDPKERSKLAALIRQWTVDSKNSELELGVPGLYSAEEAMKYVGDKYKYIENVNNAKKAFNHIASFMPSQIKKVKVCAIPTKLFRSLCANKNFVGFMGVYDTADGPQVLCVLKAFDGIKESGGTIKDFADTISHEIRHNIELLKIEKSIPGLHAAVDEYLKQFPLDVPWKDRPGEQKPIKTGKRFEQEVERRLPMSEEKRREVITDLAMAMDRTYTDMLIPEDLPTGLTAIREYLHDAVERYRSNGLTMSDFLKDADGFFGEGIKPILKEFEKEYKDSIREVDGKRYQGKVHRVITDFDLAMKVAQEEVKLGRQMSDSEIKSKFGLAGDLPVEMRVEYTQETPYLDIPAVKEIRLQLGDDGVPYVSNKRAVNWITQFVMSPYRALKEKNPEAAGWAAKITDSDNLINHNKYNDRLFMEDLTTDLSKADQLKMKTVYDHMFEMMDAQKNPKLTIYEKMAIKTSLADLMKNDPMYQKAWQIHEWYEGIRKEYIRSRLEMFDVKLNDDQRQAMNVVKAAAKEFGWDQLAVRYKMADGKPSPKTKLQEIAEKYGVGDAQLKKLVRDYHGILDWGRENFRTKIEIGTYKVIDRKTEHVRAVGKTLKEALERASRVEERDPSTKGNLFVTAEFIKPIDPTSQRTGVLAGEDNIFDAMRSYSHIMWKRIVLDPLESKMEKEFNLDKSNIVYPGTVQEMLREQLVDTRGRYSWGDKVTDQISRAFGSQPRLFSRGVSKARKVTGIEKLGYRPVAAFMNLYGGVSNVYSMHGYRLLKEGIAFRKTVEGQALLKAEEAYLGMDFTSEVTGKHRVKLKGGILHPLGLFSKPEPFIRETSYLVNYLDAKGQGMGETAARQYARRGVEAEAFLYNVASLPRLLRGPGGKLTLQFKTFFVRQLELISQMNGKQLTRYFATQMAISGPRGVYFMIKSIPILGLLGILDKIEEDLLSKPGYMQGIPGMLGADVTAPATLQFTGSNPEDLAGPFLSDMIKFGKMVLAPWLRGEKFVTDEVVDWAKQLPVILRYWDNFIQAQVTDDGWIRGEGGTKQYKIGGLWDEALLAMGIPPLEKTRNATAQRILKEENLRDKNSKERLVLRILGSLEKGKQPPQELWEIAASLGLAPQTILDRKMFNEMTPQERNVMRSQIIKRARAWGLFEKIPE